MTLYRSVARRGGAIAILAAAVVAGACRETTAPLVTAWRATLDPVLPYTVSGRAAALTRAGRTQATISIEHAEAGVTHSWRIETGTCAAPGALQGGPSSYPELVPGPGGSASSEAAIAQLFRSGQALIVRVLREGDGGGIETAACATFEETAP